MPGPLKTASRTLAIALALAGSVDLRGQQPAVQPDGVQLLIHRLEQVVQSGDAQAYLQLLAASALPLRALDFSSGDILPGATHAVVQERDRAPLSSAPPNSGYRLVVDTFIEFGARARIATWRLDVTRAGPGDDAWRIADQEHLTSVENLYRLSVDPTKEFEARNLTISAEDLDLTLETGSVFLAAADQGTTALVLLGRGEMNFHPEPDTERGQVRIFCGEATLKARFETAFVRINPYDYDRLISSDHLVARPVDPRELRRAEDVFREESPKTFHVDLGDLSRDLWSMIPAPGDLVAEVHTRRFDTLTYAHSASEAEDISLFDRKKRRNIALYTSKDKLANRGRSYDENERADYDVIDYNIDLAVSPGRQFLEGVARLLMRIRSASVGTLTLRLADSLVVRSIVSDRHGRLFGFRVSKQNSLVVNLPTALDRDTLMTLTVVYSGRLEPQSPDRETAWLALDQAALQGEGIVTEPNFLYSNRSYWYPQASFTDYATATIKLSVPPAYDCVASGELEPGWPAIVAAKDGSPGRKLYWFSATQPLRYLAFIVSRFARSETLTIALPELRKPDDGEKPRRGTYYDSLNLSVEANPRQAQRGRELSERAADIAQFYTSILGDCPYPAFTIALVESELPGGHSPAYFAELNQPLPTSPLVWRNDPAAFSNYPEFFLAHELAHQWWGQAVGWRNYHEQWVSEGFAQYFAALYAEHHRGHEVFSGVIRQMRRWGIDQSDQGPIFLGYRLGHIRGDSKVFRALVYNKSAAVLHMLRRLVGDDAFFRGVRRFYRTSRFRKVGTEDFRAAMEAEADRPLERFFERWIYGATLPRLRFGYRTEGADLVLHVEQVGELFDVPLTMTVQYADRKAVDLVVPVTDRVADMRVPLAGVLRSVDVSKEDGSLAEIVK